MREISISRNLATILGFLSIVLWSSCVALVRSLSEQLGVFTAGMVIYFAAALISVVYNLVLRGRITSPRGFKLKFLLIVGGFFAIDIVAFYLSVSWASDHAQLLEVSLVNYLWPCLTVVLSIPILRNKASWVIAPGILLVILGMVLVTTDGYDFSLAGFSANVLSNPWAYGAGLAAAVFWALYSNLNKLWGEEGQEGILYIFILATALCLMAAGMFFEEPRVWSTSTIFEVLAMAVVVALGYEFWDLGLRKGDFVLVSISSYFTPLLATLVASYYLGVTVGVKLWIGCALIILGAYVSERALKKD